MSKQIWKYDLAPKKLLDLPKGAEILSVHAQNNKPYLWALVDTTKPTEIRRFLMYGTGWEITHQAGNFLGTIFLQQGDFVFHVFEDLS